VAQAAPPLAAVPALRDDFEEAEPSFISDEPLEETPTMITPAYSEMGRSMFDDPKVPPPPPAAVALAAEEDLSYVEELPEPEPEPDELMDVSPEESSTLHGESEGADDMPAPWAQPTVEVPLELRAQASVESAAAAAASEPAFDEVFEEEPSAPAASAKTDAHERDVHQRAAHDDFGYARAEDVVGSTSSPSVPSAAASQTLREGFGWGGQPDVPVTPPAAPAPSPFAARSAPEPEKRAPEPFAVAPPPESSFSSMTEDEGPEPVSSSVAAEVGVPVDMVEKIAQRVVAQISEKVIREIAWEVIPDLAESLIKKEIDRLKAELQQT
jgi:hypothetical protein